MVWGIWIPHCREDSSLSTFLTNSRVDLRHPGLLKNWSLSQGSGRGEEQDWLQKGCQASQTMPRRTELSCRRCWVYPIAFINLSFLVWRLLSERKAFTGFPKARAMKTKWWGTHSNSGRCSGYFGRLREQCVPNRFMKFARVWKKKKKEKKKCSIFLMSASGGSWAAAECQRLGRAQPLSFAFLPETVGWRPLRTELGQPTAPLRPQRGQGTRPGHRSAVSQPPALFLSLLCPFSRFPLEWDSHQALKSVRGWRVQTRLPQQISRTGWRSRECASAAGLGGRRHGSWSPLLEILWCQARRVLPTRGRRGETGKRWGARPLGLSPKRAALVPPALAKAESLCVSVCQPQSGTGDVYAPLIHLHPEDSRGGPLQRL